MWRAILACILAGLLLSPGRPQAAEDPAGRAEDLTRQAVRAFGERDFRAAETLARQAWDLCQAGTAGRQAGFAAANLGAALAVQGRLEEALEWQGRAEEVFAREGDALAQGRLALARAVVFYLKGKEKEALASLDLARGLFGKDDFRLACVESEVRSSSNDGEQAQAGYVKCLEMLNVCRARGDSSGVAVCAMRMGYLEGTTGGHEDALKYYTEALQIVRVWGDTSRMGVALRNIGLANRKLRQYPESEVAYREGLSLAGAAGQRAQAAEILNDLSMLYAEMGDEARAEATDREAEAALRSVADDLSQGRQNDSVLLDFYRGIQVRFANLLPYDTDLFAGFCDQLALEPPR